MKLRIRVNVGNPSLPVEEPPLFGSFVKERRSKVVPLLGSLLVHFTLGGGVMLVSQHMDWFGYDEIDWSRYHAEPLRLHLAQPIYFNAPTPKKPVKEHAAPATQQAAVSAPAGQGSGAAPATAAVPRRLELPAPRAAAKDGPVILQPDYQPQLKPPPTSMPSMAFWARQAAPPKPAPKAPVVPGRTEAPAPTPKLAAPPVLAVPNRETAVAPVNIALPPAPPQMNPSLPVPNSATAPIRLRDANEAKMASFEVSAGQGVNVMAISNEQKDIRNVEIPKGLQNIPRAAAGDSAGASATAAATGAAASSSAASGAPGSNSSVAGAGAGPNAGPNANGAGAGPRTAANGGGRGAPSSSTSANAASNSAGPGSSPSGSSPSAAGERAGLGPAAPAVPARPLGTPDVTRIQHPTNGDFDVVIMQSAAREDLPDLGGMLSGNPVYTVYLRVGDRKEWLLEYCVPARDNQQSSQYQVNIDEVGAITPPYPVSTVIPNSMLAFESTRHIVLHGFLTTTGTLRSIKAPDSNTPFMTQLLALLNQWQFRPALRNKKPIDVEILLVIPPRG